MFCPIDMISWRKMLKLNEHHKMYFYKIMGFQLCYATGDYKQGLNIHIQAIKQYQVISGWLGSKSTFTWNATPTCTCEMRWAQGWIKREK